MEYLSVDKKWTFSLILKYLYQLLFWYCALLCIPVCACAMSRAQKKQWTALENIFMLKMLTTLPQYSYFLEKVAIHSSHGYKRECLNPWVNFAGRISVKKDTFENIFGKIWSLLWNKNCDIFFKETNKYSSWIYKGLFNSRNKLFWSN